MTERQPDEQKPPKLHAVLVVFCACGARSLVAITVTGTTIEAVTSPIPERGEICQGASSGAMKLVQAGIQETQGRLADDAGQKP